MPAALKCTRGSVALWPGKGLCQWKQQALRLRSSVLVLLLPLINCVTWATALTNQSFLGSYFPGERSNGVLFYFVLLVVLACFVWVVESGLITRNLNELKGTFLRNVQTILANTRCAWQNEQERQCLQSECFGLTPTLPVSIFPTRLHCQLLQTSPLSTISGSSLHCV